MDMPTLCEAVRQLIAGKNWSVVTDGHKARVVDDSLKDVVAEIVFISGERPRIHVGPSNSNLVWGTFEQERYDGFTRQLPPNIGDYPVNVTGF